MKKRILDVQNLTVSLSTQKTIIFPVMNVSFSLYKKEILGVVGESGCGKTILSQSILKLIPSPPLKRYEGAIIFEEKNLLSLNEKELRSYRGSKISFVFQDPTSSLNPTMQIGKQIKEANPSLSNEAIFSLLNLVRIPDPKNRFFQYPHELSGGQKQRVLIAIALAQNPQILIADEPTTALDLSTQIQIIQLLKEIQKKSNLSIIFISHDLNIISKIADRIIVMHGAKIIEEDTKYNIINKPLHPYTRLLLKLNPAFSCHTYNQRDANK